MYCDRWYIPSYTSIRNKISAINGQTTGEQNLYCSIECKKACPTYKQILYPKDYKLNTSREVQPELRKLVLNRDNYTCQKCNTTNVELHCHHYEGIEVNPVESADIDQCITLCKECHNDIHRKDKCGIKDYKRGKC
jgi:5-methylcytosine-specific restriction endonuclease McrA